MKYELINEGRTPYGGGYVINRPELGMVGKGRTFARLMNDVIAYRKANGQHIGLSFRDDLTALVCEQYPKECEPVAIDGLPRRKPARIGLRDLLMGTEVCLSVAAARIKAWLGVGKSPIVDEVEAERRAAICANCRYNGPIQMACGGGCPELKAMVESLIGKRSTSQDGKLNNCGICKCYLSAAVWVDVEMQLEPLDAETVAQFGRIPWCWKKRTTTP